MQTPLETLEPSICLGKVERKKYKSPDNHVLSRCYLATGRSEMTSIVMSQPASVVARIVGKKQVWRHTSRSVHRKNKIKTVMSPLLLTLEVSDNHIR